MIRLRVGTRGSELALRQTNWVCGRLVAACADVQIEQVIIKTHGDVATDDPFGKEWPVGAFVSAIEQALLDRRIDFAVHSYKDLPTEQVSGLTVAAVPPRAAVNDLLLIRRDRVDSSQEPWPLVIGARVGTSATRRVAQLRVRRPDLVCVEIRGNVPTRVRKVREGLCDAVVLAQAGLELQTP